MASTGALLDTLKGTAELARKGQFLGKLPGADIRDNIATECRLHAALITSQVERLMVLIEPSRVVHKELKCLENRLLSKSKLGLDLS